MEITDGLNIFSNSIFTIETMITSALVSTSKIASYTQELHSIVNTQYNLISLKNSSDNLIGLQCIGFSAVLSETSTISSSVGNCAALVQNIPSKLTYIRDNIKSYVLGNAFMGMIALYVFIEVFVVFQVASYCIGGRRKALSSIVFSEIFVMVLTILVAFLIATMV